MPFGIHSSAHPHVINPHATALVGSTSLEEYNQEEINNMIREFKKLGPKMKREIVSALKPHIS